MTRSLSTVLIGAAALLYALAFGECFLRVFAPQAIMPRYVVGTAWGIRGNQPNLTYRQWTPETRVTIHTNALGMRDDDNPPFEPPPDTCRIALLGDSYMMGYEVSLQDSIAGTLERLLVESGYRVDVLNFAVSGHGTSEMLLHYENLAKRFDPDVVVFQFHDSDFDDNVRANLHRLIGGAVVRTDSSYLPAVGVRLTLESFAVYRWISQNSQLYAGIRERVSVLTRRLLAAWNAGRAAGSPGPGADSSQTAGDASQLAESYPVRLTARLIDLARDEVQAAGSDFYLLEIPSWISRTHLHSEFASMELKAGTEASAVSTLQALRNRADSETKLYYEQGHLHLSPLGNRLVAEELVGRLATQSSQRLDACRM